MEKILSEVLAEDRNLLFRSNEFIFALERRIPPNLQRQFAPIKAALKLNVGKFFATDKDDYIARYNVIKNLVEGGMNEGKINFVLKTFEQVLITDKESKEINRLQKFSNELEMEVTQLREENSSLKKVNSDLQWQLEEISNDNRRLQKETSSLKNVVSELNEQPEKVSSNNTSFDKGSLVQIEQAPSEKNIPNTSDTSKGTIDKDLATFVEETFSKPAFMFEKFVYPVGRSNNNEKVKKAIADYALLKDGEFILVYCDFFNLALKDLMEDLNISEKIILTNMGIYVHNPSKDTKYFPYKKIRSIELKGFLLKILYINDIEVVTTLNPKELENFGALLMCFTAHFAKISKVKSNIYDRFEAITLGASETSDENANEFADFLEETFAKSKFRFDNFVYPNGRDNKSTEKVNKAIATYANLKNGELGMVCCDITLLGSAEDGLLLTNMGIYVHNPYQKTSYFPYEKIYSIELKGIIVKDIYINGFKVITTFSNKEKENFVELLWHFSSHFGGLSKT